MSCERRPALRIALEEGRRSEVVADVVHQDVDRAEPRSRSRDELRVRGVANDRLDLPTARRPGRSGPFRVDLDERHVASGTGEHVDDRGADSGSPARDDGPPPREAQPRHDSQSSAVGWLGGVRSTRLRSSTGCASILATDPEGADVPTTHLHTCTLCEATCGVVVTVDGDQVVVDPRRQGRPVQQGLHLPQGAGARRPPPRPRPAAHGRWCGGRRLARGRAGTRRSTSWRRGCGRSAPSTAATRSAIYQGNPTAHNLGLLTYGQLLLRALAHHEPRTRRPRSTSCRTCSRPT